MTNKQWQKWTRRDEFDREQRKIESDYLAYVRSEETVLRKRIGELPSNKSRMYHSFVKQKLKVLQKCDEFTYKGVHFARIVSELALDRYKCKQVALSRLKKLFKQGQNRSLLLVGHSPIGRNSPIKGYIRLPLNPILKVLQEDGHIDVYYRDEFGSTKYCSFCRQEVFVSPRIGSFAV